MNDYSGMVYTADGIDGWSGDHDNWDGKGNARASARGMASNLERRNNITNTRKLIAVLGSVSAIVGLFAIIPGFAVAATVASIAISATAVVLACTGTLSTAECNEEKEGFVFSTSLGIGWGRWVSKPIRNELISDGVEAIGGFSQSVYGILNSASGYRDAQWSR